MSVHPIWNHFHNFFGMVHKAIAAINSSVVAQMIHEVLYFRKKQVQL